MNTVSGVGVLDKSVLVLRTVASSAAPVSLAEIESRTTLPRATAHRLAQALVEHGLLRRTADQRFDLGPELAVLGRVAAQRFPLGAIAEPMLEDLRDLTGESVQLFVAERGGRRCIRSLQSPHALQWVVPEGALYPLAHGSAGRVLSGEPGRDGWVATVAEREAGVASVSAPVVVAGAVVAAVSVSGPIERMTSTPGAKFGDAVVAAANAIATALAGEFPATATGGTHSDPG